MKIALLTHEPFYPPTGGGSAEAVYLVRELTSRGHEVHVFCPKLIDPEIVEHQFHIKLHGFQKWRMGRYTAFRNFKYMLYPRFLQRMVEQSGIAFDLIFSQHAISAVAAGRLKARMNIPVVMNFLDYLTGFMDAWPRYLAPPPLLLKLKRFELSLPNRFRADGVLTVSDTLADYFAHTGYPRERIRPIYYGFDSELFRFRRDQPLSSPGPVVVMHGSLDHHHLREIALEAMIHAALHRPETVLKIIGHRTGVLERFVKRLRKRAPDARLETTGFIPYTEVADALATGSVGIVPYEESVGTHCAFVAKIVEYLAVGLPVVCTPLDSAKRYFKDEPMIRFSEFDGPDFGRKIISWFDEPPEKFQAQARAASERVRTNLDWRVISQRAVDFIERTWAKKEECP